MNTPTPQSDDLQMLLAALVEGSITDEQFQTLDQLMSGDSANREEYRRYVELHAMLQFEHRPQPAAMPDLLPGTGSDLDHLILPPSNFRASSLFGSAGLGWVLFGVALTAFAILWWAGRSGDDFRMATGKNVKAPSVHTLSGTTKLMLPDIGYVIVDGPAEFDMVDPMRARLTKGRIKMRVTEVTGHGFVVETPFGNVTDLGTEFGLNVPEDGSSAGLVVFDGEVDLQVKQSIEPQEFAGAYRLAQGEGVTFNNWGQLAPIGSIVTGTVATFLQAGETVGNELPPLIASVNDNQRQSGKIKFYEIVPGGLTEDVKRYVDRPHEWNGVTSDGIPAYLQGADYVRTFGHDGSSKNLEIYVTLTAPAKLYVLLDDRTQPPEWLKKDFRDTGDKIGADAGPWGAVNRTSSLAVGAGNSIDFSCTVWERIVSKAEVVTLKSSVPKGTKPHHAMYGIAAVPLEAEKASNSEGAISKSSSKSE